MHPFPKVLTVLTASLLVPLAGCIIALDADCDFDHPNHSNSVQGSGVRKTETRTAADFDRIEVRCGADLEVRAGEDLSLEVSGDDNLLAHLRTEVRSGTLVIEMDSGSYRPKADLRIVAKVPALRSLSVEGSSDATVSGLAGESFAIEISGSGDARATGKVDRVEAEIQGSGDIDFADLEAREARVEISGSGDVQVWATENLTASISGSGDVRYKGEPKITKSVAGSGSIAKR